MLEKNPVSLGTPQLHSEGASNGDHPSAYIRLSTHFQSEMHVQNAMPRQKVEVQLAAEKEHGHVAF
jgi:hypothetical protein